MLIDPPQLLAALRLPADSTLNDEPLGERIGSPERIRIDPPGAAPVIVVVRRPGDGEAAANHAAVMDALATAGYAHAPRLLAVLEGATVESWVDGGTALAFVPPAGACEAAVEALAALHSLPIREGLDWERSPEQLLPSDDVPLYRLGFAAREREAALEPLARAHAAILGTPFGFAHREATAARLLLAPGRATLINYTRAGFGPQLFDLAAFLLTAGLEAAGRRALAHRYAALRGLEPQSTADLVDLAGLLWGFETLLGLPRRLVEALGDDAESAELNTAAGRIDKAMRAPTGEHPAAAAIRAALWPA